MEHQTSFPFPDPKPQEFMHTVDYRQHLLEKARVLGVGIVHIFNPDYPKGGLTVAFRKVSRYRNGKMVEVAVATCSRQDTFSKKIGTQLALEQFFDERTILLPLLEYNDPREINGIVKTAFSDLYSSIY